MLLPKPHVDHGGRKYAVHLPSTPPRFADRRSLWRLGFLYFLSGWRCPHGLKPGKETEAWLAGWREAYGHTLAEATRDAEAVGLLLDFVRAHRRATGF